MFEPEYKKHELIISWNFLYSLEGFPSNFAILKGYPILISQIDPVMKYQQFFVELLYFTL
jgi:hypothetical protein